MKIITFIIAICMLTFSVMPCYDIHDDCKTMATSQIVHSDNHNTDKEDFCSPFCVCFCCRNIALQQENFSEVILLGNVFLNKTKISLNTNFTESAFLHSIWQPPKV
jgi:activator of 2-hydroxyglutaryl-CoA dehydratase